jgi:hypothetical protein
MTKIYQHHVDAAIKALKIAVAANAHNYENDDILLFQGAVEAFQKAKECGSFDCVNLTMLEATTLLDHIDHHRHPIAASRLESAISRAKGFND